MRAQIIDKISKRVYKIFSTPMAFLDWPRAAQEILQGGRHGVVQLVSRR